LLWYFSVYRDVVLGVLVSAGKDTLVVVGIANFSTVGLDTMAPHTMNWCKKWRQNNVIGRNGLKELLVV